MKRTTKAAKVVPKIPILLVVAILVSGLVYDRTTVLVLEMGV